MMYKGLDACFCGLIATIPRSRTVYHPLGQRLRRCVGATLTDQATDSTRDHRLPVGACEVAVMRDETRRLKLSNIHLKHRGARKCTMS